MTGNTAERYTIVGPCCQTDLERDGKIQSTSAPPTLGTNLAATQPRTLVEVSTNATRRTYLSRTYQTKHRMRKDAGQRKDILASGNICFLGPSARNRKPVTKPQLTDHIKSDLENKMIKY